MSNNHEAQPPACWLEPVSDLKPIRMILSLSDSPATPHMSRSKLRVTLMAVKMLVITPKARVMAKPLTILAPKFEPNQNKIAQVMSVLRAESRIEGQERLKPSSMASFRLRPFRNSSFIRSKTRMLASTAMPTDKIKPVMAGKVSVTGIIL